MDFDQIRAAYVTGKEDYRQLAERFGVSKKSIEQHGKREGWVRQRRAYRKSVAEKAIRKKGEQDAEKLGRLLETADALVGVIQRVSQDRYQFFRRQSPEIVIDAETGEKRLMLLEDVGAKADMRALADATKALNELTRAVRNLYDIPTGEENRRYKMDLRRLVMLEKKEHGGVDPDQYGVIPMPATGEVDTENAREVTD